MLIEILCTRTNQEIMAIKQEYKTSESPPRMEGGSLSFPLSFPPSSYLPPTPPPFSCYTTTPSTCTLNELLTITHHLATTITQYHATIITALYVHHHTPAQIKKLYKVISYNSGSLMYTIHSSHMQKNKTCSSAISVATCVCLKKKNLPCLTNELP